MTAQFWHEKKRKTKKQKNDFFVFFFGRQKKWKKLLENSQYFERKTPHFQKFIWTTT